MSKNDNSIPEKLTVFEAYDAACEFVYSIKDQAEKQFTPNDFYWFSVFGGYLDDNPASIDDLRCSYLKITGRELENPRKVYPLNLYPLLDKETMSSNMAFNVLCELSIWHLNEFDYQFPQFVDLLQSMVNKPENYADEWELWKKTVKKIKSR